MIDELEPYSTYKDSRLPSIGQMPRHWNVLAIRRFSRVFAGATPSRAVPAYWQNGSIPWLASGDVNLRRIRSARQFITKAGFANSSTKWIRPGSLVIALAGQGRTKGMVATVELEATCNQSLAVIEPHSQVADYRFVAYWLESQYLNLRSLVGNGLRDGLNLEHVRSIYTPLPPPDEQAGIVRFLDWTNARLERTIAAKRKVIMLLNEQKQAIIHRAVTRGLDPSAPLKPSGIPWIGDIPEHWEARKLRQLLSRATERNRPDLALLSVVREKGVIERDTEDREGNHNFIPEDLSNYKVVRTGQFAMNKMKAWQGSYGVSPLDGIVSPAYFVFNLRVAEGAFFHTAIRSKAYVPFFTQASDGVRVGQWDLVEPRMKEITFFFPSEAEQVAIVDFVNRETTGISVAISHLEREIELFREYRTRLVADVVTGKLDVREAAARLPDEALPDISEDVADLGEDLDTVDEEATA